MNDNNRAAAERKKLAGLVGTRENAGALFKSKCVNVDLEFAGRLILERLEFVEGVNSLYTNFDCMSDSDVSEWGTRCWANTVAHLCETDSEVRSAVTAGRSMLPDDAYVQEQLIAKVLGAFGFFLWVIAGPRQSLDSENACSVKLIVLNDAILLENIDARHDGKPGGWGLLDKTISALRELAAALQINRIKAIATNERVYRAFLRRGFRDRTEVDGLLRYVENYSKPIELIL